MCGKLNNRDTTSKNKSSNLYEFLGYRNITWPTQWHKSNIKVTWNPGMLNFDAIVQYLKMVVIQIYVISATMYHWIGPTRFSLTT